MPVGVRRVRRSIVALALATSALVACNTSDTPAALTDRGRIADALRDAGLTGGAARLVHFSHVCDLVIDTTRYAVVDLRELYGSGPSPRGLNRVVVLDGSLSPIQSFEYGSARPLFCRESRLFLYGSISLGNVGAAGNVLEFSDAGRSVAVVDDLEASELPLDPAQTR